MTINKISIMKPYIISHMMISVDGRIDCPMVAQISGKEYYTALESFGISSELSGRVTADYCRGGEKISTEAFWKQDW